MYIHKSTLITLFLVGGYWFARYEDEKNDTGYMERFTFVLSMGTLIAIELIGNWTGWY